MTGPHILGFVHQALHQEQAHWDHIKAMQYRSATVFKDYYGNSGYVDTLRSCMPAGALYLARDHALTEQHDDLNRDPTQAGLDHADAYVRQVQNGECLLPVEFTYFMGLNEVSTYDNLQGLIEYDLAFLNRLHENGLKGAALRISTGHPPTWDYTPATKANWTVFDEVFDLVIEQAHIAVINEYGRADDMFVGDNILRIQNLHRFDFEIIIGEVGIDDAVNRPPDWGHYGYQLKPGILGYREWLNTVHRLYTGFPNVLAINIFIGDFAHPWESFNIFIPEMMKLMEEGVWDWENENNVFYQKWVGSFDMQKIWLPLVTGPGALTTKEIIRQMRSLVDDLEEAME